MNVLGQKEEPKYYVDELHRAIGSQYFKPLIEHGVTLIKVEKGVA